MNDDPSRQWQPPSEPANAQDDPPHQQPRPAPAIGFVEWFWPGDFDRVEQILADMKSLGVTDLRTGVSWANWFTPWGERWYAWLLPRLAKEVTVMPCFLYTPPSLGIAAKSSSPPRNTKLFADFVDVMITRFGQCFEYVELWNEANNRNEWDWTLDPYWYNFGEMVGSAAYWARERGKKTVLAGMSPIDPNWLNLMFQRGVMDHIDVVGVHGFPGTMDSNWDGWQANIGRVRRELDMNRSRAEIWITETGFSTWRHDEYTQLRSLVSALDAPVQRVYWYALHDLNPDRPTVEGFHSDERGYHFGLKTANGIPKLLYRIWNGGGLDAVRKTAVYMSNERRPPLDDAVLITGGAGFIGSNLAHRLLENGRNVIIFDNLSRHGVEENLRWLTDRYAERVQVHLGDMRDRYALRLALEDAREVFHFAAQVAVTSSMTDPMLDFGVNALGTLNLLEEARSLRHPPSVVFTSTNKVYGALGDVTLTADGRRYDPSDPRLRAAGINESRLLDFHSPYGCSKGAADQYVIDYARCFGQRTVVFRMSCIYGPHQFGTIDQGWVAHFISQAAKGFPITLYGDGMQVRDVLFIDDLIDAFLLAESQIDRLSGQAFNLGGGPANAISLLELLDIIAELCGRRPEVQYDDWRPGDQRYYVSDTSRFSAATGWKAKVDVRTGVARLYEWLTRGEPRVAAAASSTGAHG